MVGGCADNPSPTPPSSDAASPQPLVVTGTARDPQWVLTIGSPRRSWNAGEAILVQAELQYVGPGGGTQYFGSGSGPLGFGLREIGGTRHLEGVMTADCATYQITAEAPLLVNYHKSGGFIGEDPNAAFYRLFLQDPLLHLPNGTWALDAYADLIMPPGCGTGRIVQLLASITLTVE